MVIALKNLVCISQVFENHSKFRIERDFINKNFHDSLQWTNIQFLPHGCQSSMRFRSEVNSLAHSAVNF